MTHLRRGCRFPPLFVLVLLPLLPSRGLAAAEQITGDTFHLLSKLPFDENGRLSTHLLVYPESCKSAIGGKFIAKPYGRELHAVAGEAQTAFFGKDFDNDNDGNEEHCQAKCVERGTDHSIIEHVMPMYHYDPSKDASHADQSVLSWTSNTCDNVEVSFINYHKKKTPLQVYWVDDRGTRHPNVILKYGEKNGHRVKTFLGHKFLFANAHSGKILLEHTVEFNGVLGLGQNPSLVDPSVNNTKKIRAYFREQWTRHQNVPRSFTPLGFSKGRLPPDLFASMGAFYHNNAGSGSREEFNAIQVNWWEFDCYFVVVPWDLKTMWQSRLKAMVEEWAGLSLDNTDIYGMRRYETGSRLLFHTDREETHAASLIVNIAQGGVTKPWTVEIFDHADRLHEITMQPGDIVYYESAKCLHGRNAPLKGGYYVNLFAHYRPAGGDQKWYTKDNPSDTPKPLMDVGQCRLEGGRNDVSQGAVKCDNPEIGPYLSPSMFQATGGKDLFEWWEMAGKDIPDAAGEGVQKEKFEL